MDETTAAMHQDRAKMFLMPMPMDAAAVWSKAVARMATPSREYLKNSEKTVKSSAARMNAAMYTGEMGSPATKRGSCGSTSGKTRMSVPQNSCTRALSTVESPIVTMITLMMGSPIMGRSTSRSMARPRTTEKPRVIRNAARKGS